MLPPSQPSPADENAAHPSPPRVQDLLDFVLRYEADRTNGVVRTLEHYQALFPHAIETVAREFHRLQAEARASDVIDRTKQLARIDHYLLEREIGRGAQGRVYLALDTRMRRRVALKVLGRANLSPDTLRRFQREVEVIAKLDHHGLCSVYEAKLDGARPYLAMRYVEGEDLARQIRHAKTRGGTSGFVGPRTPIALAQLLQVFERAARALHAAHEAGVIHRDVKPANILVRSTGEPVIVDFGLARNEDPEAEVLTQTKDVMGTPPYMAPELLDSGHSSVDRRADVYALGVALYECLTLERPYVGSLRDTVFDQIRRGVYANPREKNPLVGEDLRVVLATALEVDPKRRYASALALAEDLRRVREYEPIRARPATWPTRLRRWTQRHPRLATSFAVVVAVIGASLGTLFATVKRVRAESARARAANERLLGVALREQSNAALRSNAGLALRLAIESDERDAGFESNMSLLRALEASHEERSLSPVPGKRIGILGSRAHGDRVVAISSDGLHLFDTADSAPEWTAPFPPKVFHGLQVSPDGSRIAFFGGTDVHVCDGQTGARLYTFSHDGATPGVCQFSADSRWLVTGSLDGIARVFDARTGALLRSFAPGTGTITLARFDPSGRFVVTATDGRRDGGPVPVADFEPRLWNASTGELLAVLTGHSTGVRGAVFTPDGRHLVTVCVDGVLRCWNTNEATLSWFGVLPGEAWSLDMSPDGLRVVAGFDSGARVFDIIAGERLVDLEDFRERSVMSVAFSPDGRSIAAADYGGGVGVWKTIDGTRVMKARCAWGGLGFLSWLSDSMRFVTSAGDSVAHVWTTQPIPLLNRWHSRAGRIRSSEFSPSSDQVLTAGDDGWVELRGAVDGVPIRVWDLDRPLERAWFVGDDVTIACLALDGRVFRIEGAANAVCVRTAEASASVRACVTARDGSTVLAGFDDGRVAWIDARDGRTLLEEKPGDGEISVVAISPDGTRAAWCSHDGSGGAADRTSGRRFAFELEAELRIQQVHALAFVIDGSRIVANSNAKIDTTIQFDDGLRRDLHLTRPIAAIVPLRGARLLTAYKWVPGVALHDEARDMRGWERPTYGERGRFVTLRVNSTEELALAASDAGFASLWRVADGELIVRYEHGSSPLTCAEFSPDGRAVVTAAEDGSVRVWPIDLRGTARAHVPAPAEVWQSRFPKSLDDE